MEFLMNLINSGIIIILIGCIKKWKKYILLL